MPKTLMPSSRLSYGFSFILQLNTHFIARYLILALCVNSRWNGKFLGPFWEQREEEQEAGRNVVTSGQQEEEVNKWSTSRRLNVATSARILFQHH